MPQLDAPALEQVLGTWIQATLVAPADEPLALDGKTVRGAKSGELAAPYLLAFCTYHSQETLWQVRVRDREGEFHTQVFEPTSAMNQKWPKP